MPSALALLGNSPSEWEIEGGGSTRTVASLNEQDARLSIAIEVDVTMLIARILSDWRPEQVRVYDWEEVIKDPLARWDHSSMPPGLRNLFEIGARASPPGSQGQEMLCVVVPSWPGCEWGTSELDTILRQFVKQRGDCIYGGFERGHDQERFFVFCENAERQQRTVLRELRRHLKKHLALLVVRFGGPGAPQKLVEI